MAIASGAPRINAVNNCKVSRFSRSTHGVLEPETEVLVSNYLEQLVRRRARFAPGQKRLAASKKGEDYASKVLSQIPLGHCRFSNRVHWSGLIEKLRGRCQCPGHGHFRLAAGAGSKRQAKGRVSA